MSAFYTWSTCLGNSCNADPLTSVSVAYRIATLIAILLPVIVLFVIGYHLWGWGLFWRDLVLLFVMYSLAAVGTTVGFHRLFTHRSFETHRSIKFVLGVLGSMSVQGPLLRWVAIHRRHHQHSDQADDPHSPHRSNDGDSSFFGGIFHAHLGWLFKADAPGLDGYIGDLHKDRSMRQVNDWFVVWALLGFVIPAAIGGLVTGTWRGALLGFLWGGLVRMFVGHHVTWCINSVCHLWGSRPYATRDESRNNSIFGILAFGEGWHNNHHAFPTSARHGFRWWQLDMSYVAICILKWLGLAWHVRVPAACRERPTARLAHRPPIV